MGRLIKDIPKTFNKVKSEYDRLTNLYWCSKLNDNNERINSPENIGLMHILNQELMNFAEINFHKTGEKILDLMKEKNIDKIYLYEYGKVIRFDEEAQWLFVEDISQSEWKEYDLACSASYVESKKGK